MVLCRTTFFLLLTGLLTLSGCGDLLHTKVVKKPMDSSQFRTECKLDIDSFADIMVKDISSDIKCLGENLNLFIRVVETDKPGTLPRLNLEQYLRKNRPDIKEEVISALGAVYELNFLVFGDSRTTISKTNVDKLINFALTFNEQASKSYLFFQSHAEATFDRHRDQKNDVEAAAKAISMGLKNIFNPSRGGMVHSVEILKILESFSTARNRESIEKAKKLLFVKKVLVGGDSLVLTHVELERLILNFNHLVPILFDAVRYKKIKLDQKSIFQLLQSDLEWLTNMIFQDSLGNRNDTVFFTFDEAIEAIKIFTEKDIDDSSDDEPFDIEKYRNLIKEAKKMVMGGDDVEVTGADFKAFMTRANEVLRKGTIFHRIYDYFSAQLSLQGPVNIDFSSYRLQYPEHDKEVTDFQRIVTKYRFFRGKFLSPYYNLDYRRNPEGVVEIALLEYVITLAFNYSTPQLDADGNVVYGPDHKPIMVPWASSSNGLGGKSMSKDQVLALLKRFEKELLDLHIILPKRTENTAETVSLLGSLFQNQSDDNKVLDINEAAEFVQTLLTSFDISEDIFSYMKAEDKNGLPLESESRQGCPVDKFGRIEPQCFRKNFFMGMCKYYYSYYPRLFEYMGVSGDTVDTQGRPIPVEMKCAEFDPDTEHNRVYLDAAIQAARTCNYYSDGAKEEIPYTEGDVSTLLIALQHIETTILRWDTNQNNQMDPNEVNNAYSIYESALDGFVSGITAKIKKQIYQYLVKYESVPDQKDFGSIIKLVKFLLSFDKKAPATRKTIAAILKTVSDQSKKKQIEAGIPQFDCKALRNPDILDGTNKIDTYGLPSGRTRLNIEELLLADPNDSALLNMIKSQSDDEIFAELKVSHPYIFLK